MLPVAQKTFSLFFVSKKQKLKLSQGGEASAEATSAFEMVPSLWFCEIIRLQPLFPTGGVGGILWLQQNIIVFFYF